MVHHNQTLIATAVLNTQNVCSGCFMKTPRSSVAKIPKLQNNSVIRHCQCNLPHIAVLQGCVSVCDIVLYIHLVFPQSGQHVFCIAALVTESEHGTSSSNRLQLYSPGMKPVSLSAAQLTQNGNTMTLILILQHQSNYLLCLLYFSKVFVSLIHYYTHTHCCNDA